MPHRNPLIAGDGEAQRLMDDYEHYVGSNCVTVAGFTGQTHVAALCVQKVAEAGRKQRKRGVTDGTRVFSWSHVLLVSTGANGAALLRKLLHGDGPERSALMEEAWLRAASPSPFQPVFLRTSYNCSAMPPMSRDIPQQLTELVRSRLHDEFRFRAGVLERNIRPYDSGPYLVVPSVDKDSHGTLIWSEPIIDHRVEFVPDFMAALEPPPSLVTVDVVLPSSGSDRETGVNVRVHTHTLAVLMAYEIHLIWRGLDTSFPANNHVHSAYAIANMHNLLLLYHLYRSNPAASVCSLDNFATFAHHAATIGLGADGYRRMYKWIMLHMAPQELGSGSGREVLAKTVVVWWTNNKVFPSFSDQNLSSEARESWRREAAALLCETFQLVYNLIAHHPPANATSTSPHRPHPAFVPGDRNA